MQTYAQVASLLPLRMAFSLYVGNEPHPKSSQQSIHEVLEFFNSHFGNSTYDSAADDDEVIRFCQWGPAGNFGAVQSVKIISARYPGYSESIESCILAAWDHGNSGE